MKVGNKSTHFFFSKPLFDTFVYFFCSGVKRPPRNLYYTVKCTLIMLNFTVCNDGRPSGLATDSHVTSHFLPLYFCHRFRHKYNLNTTTRSLQLLIFQTPKLSMLSVCSDFFFSVQNVCCFWLYTMNLYLLFFFSKMEKEKKTAHLLGYVNLSTNMFSS